MPLLSKTSVLARSKDGFASTLANKLASWRWFWRWFWRWQKGFYVKYRSYGSQSSLTLPLALPSPPLRSSASPTGPSCSKSWSGSGTYKISRRMLRSPAQVQRLGSRSIHTSLQLGKSKCDSDRAKDCEAMKDICKKRKDTCVDTSCKKKDEECYPERPKCVPREDKKDIDDDEQVCPKSCVRGGKCIIAPIKKPPKMIYGSTECPPPKLVSPRICPRTAAHDYVEEEPICSEKALLRKLKKEACTPPDLPGPPTDPVPLCPCPPPPKLHPGPCPCPAQMEEIKIKPSPPCPIKDKYPCCMPIYYCPPKKPCVRKLPCDQVKKNKSFEK